MSRIGRLPIAIPAGVTVDIAENNKVTVKGPKGTLERVLPAEMKIEKDGEEIKVSRPNDLKKMKSLHGLTRTLINNMIIGVTEAPERKDTLPSLQPLCRGEALRFLDREGVSRGLRNVRLLRHPLQP